MRMKKKLFENVANIIEKLFALYKFYCEDIDWHNKM